STTSPRPCASKVGSTKPSPAALGALARCPCLAQGGARTFHTSHFHKNSSDIIRSTELLPLPGPSLHSLLVDISRADGTDRAFVPGDPAMSRTVRRQLWTNAACYHVLNRGHARETILHDDEDRVRFLGFVARYRDRFGFRLYHYCLMENHFHLFLQLPHARPLSPLLARP